MWAGSVCGCLCKARGRKDTGASAQFLVLLEKNRISCDRWKSPPPYWTLIIFDGRKSMQSLPSRTLVGRCSCNQISKSNDFLFWFFFCLLIWKKNSCAINGRNIGLDGFASVVLSTSFLFNNYCQKKKQKFVYSHLICGKLKSPTTNISACGTCFRICVDHIESIPIRR